MVFETVTPYHQIRVVDERGLRILSFDGSQETRMSLQNPLTGHFEYTEYFHMPWLWRTNLTNVLMIGLGGASTQRAFLYYYPGMTVETVELDPTVVTLAKQYFHLSESPRHRIVVSDGRQHLRRSQKQYDAIILDAYRSSRYGSFIPYHLATKEFFQLCQAHLNGDGVVAYNVIGTYHGWQADILGAMYRTMRTVFPQVYLFPARDSYNVVLVGTKSAQLVPMVELRRRAYELTAQRRVTVPGFLARAAACRYDPPPAAARSPILTDDYAPVDGLLTRAR